MTFLPILIAIYLCLVGLQAQFEFIKDKKLDRYFLTSEASNAVKMPVKKGDVLLRKVVSRDNKRDLYVGKVTLLGVEETKGFVGMFKQHIPIWKIEHTDSEIHDAAYFNQVKLPKAAKAKGMTWLNTDPWWEWGYAADAEEHTKDRGVVKVGKEHINDGKVRYNGECVEKLDDEHFRVWKTDRHPKGEWNLDDIGKDPTVGVAEQALQNVGETIGGWFGIGKSKKAKRMRYGDRLLDDGQDYYDEGGYEDDYELFRRLRRDKVDIEALKSFIKEY